MLIAEKAVNFFANAIWCNASIASEVILEITRCKCILSLLYGTEAEQLVC